MDLLFELQVESTVATTNEDCQQFFQMSGFMNLCPELKRQAKYHLENDLTFFSGTSTEHHAAVSEDKVNRFQQGQIHTKTKCSVNLSKYRQFSLFYNRRTKFNDITCDKLKPLLTVHKNMYRYIDTVMFSTNHFLFARLAAF